MSRHQFMDIFVKCSSIGLWIAFGSIVFVRDKASLRSAMLLVYAMWVGVWFGLQMLGYIPV